VIVLNSLLLVALTSSCSIRACCCCLQPLSCCKGYYLQVVDKEGTKKCQPCDVNTYQPIAGNTGDVNSCIPCKNVFDWGAGVKSQKANPTEWWCHLPCEKGLIWMPYCGCKEEQCKCACLLLLPLLLLLLLLLLIPRILRQYDPPIF